MSHGSVRVIFRESAVASIRPASFHFSIMQVHTLDYINRIVEEKNNFLNKNIQILMPKNKQSEEIQLQPN